jgi:hypothetical protein
MLKILGEYYYLDLDAIDEFIQIKDENPPLTGGTESPHISIAKYENTKLMIEVLMDDPSEVDETLREKSSELTIPFKLAFNTLLNKKLLNKY